MGMTHVAIAVANIANPDIVETVEFLVDSGATYSVVPGDILDRLGVAPMAKQVFGLADGTKISRRKGVAMFKLDGRLGAAVALFGQSGDAPIVGRLALASLGLRLDPLMRELNELPMML